MILPGSYYMSEDVVAISRDLIGKVLITRIRNRVTSAIITETEAYAGVTDKASHAFGGRHTARTSVMYRQGGIGYIYLCYGIHSLFNVVTGPEGTPHAVLIRGVLPVEGIETAMARRNAVKFRHSDYSGPGKVSEALGLHHSMSGISLLENKVWLENRGITIPDKLIKSTARIGVDYAGKDALLPYRFVIENIGIFTEWKFST